jgi:hypothetical protein
MFLQNIGVYLQDRRPEKHLQINTNGSVVEDEIMKIINSIDPCYILRS